MTITAHPISLFTAVRLISVVAGAIMFSGDLHAADFTVNSTVDAVDTKPGDGKCEARVNGELKCTLRAAIQENNSSGGNRILLPAGIYRLTLEGRNEDAAATGDLDILKSVTITGLDPKASNTRIDARGIDRVLHIITGALTTISNVTIERGETQDAAGGGILNEGFLHMRNVLLRLNTAARSFGGPPLRSIGGAVMNRGELSINDGSIESNLADQGAGIFNAPGASLALNNVVMSENSADALANGDGAFAILIRVDISFNPEGAISNRQNSRLTMIDSTVANNSGAGIFNNGRADLSRVTIRDNKGGGLSEVGGTATLAGVTISHNTTNERGGGIRNNHGLLTLTNVTISGNSSAGMGGGIYSDYAVSLNNVTITGNISDEGAGILNSGTMRLRNTIVASQFGRDCVGAITSEGHNLDSDGSCNLDKSRGDKPGEKNPMLGALADNGGPTETHGLLPGSPAIDAGDDHLCPDIDQRGQPRPADGDGDGRAICDIGAFELQPEERPAVLLNDRLRFERLPETYKTTSDTSACPSGFSGTFSFKARLTNIGASPLLKLVIHINTLSNDNLLANADAGGLGATLTVPPVDGFSDRVLSPGEFVDVPFEICLKEIAPFTFLVDVTGVVAR
jgi:CSLREA domain-containing protein